jgi:hypothetical protein
MRRKRCTRERSASNYSDSNKARRRPRFSGAYAFSADGEWLRLDEVEGEYGDVGALAEVAGESRDVGGGLNA